MKEMRAVLVDAVFACLVHCYSSELHVYVDASLKYTCFTGQPYMAPGASPYPVQPGTYPQGPAPTYPAYPPGRPCEYW